MRELTADLDFDAVGGLTLGADPVATAMMHDAASHGEQLNAFVVRKSEKAHGLQRRIEGPSVAGKRVLAVEDTSTTGSSVLTAVDALAEDGATTIACAVIVDRGARAAVEERGVAHLGDLAVFRVIQLVDEMLTCGVANENRQVPVFVSDDGVLRKAHPDGFASKFHAFRIIQLAVSTKRLAAGHAVNTKAIKSDVTKLQ
jgi:orotate phosphoribosyltransferase